MRRACRLIAWLTIAVCSISSDVSLYGERFKISLCRLYRTDNFSFFVENLDDKSCVSGRFGDGMFGTNLISGNAEVTEKSETQVAFSVSERSFIIDSDGRVTIVNENADDRFLRLYDCSKTLSSRNFDAPQRTAVGIRAVHIGELEENG